MAEELWNAVDDYIGERLVGEDAALHEVAKASEMAGLPAIAVAPNQGKLLHLYAKMIGAKRVLEIGTLGGYSTIWLARALPADGLVVTLEYSPEHAEVAEANIAHAGVADRVQVRVGAALDLLPDLAGEAPFDLVFIDADKQNNANYFQWALRLTKPGSVIVVDNAVRGGAIADPSRDSSDVVGTRQLYDVVSAETRVTATAVQTVGAKGHDGFLIARVN
ncbi:O-methyltransferase [Rhizocola hellebori]|uniref:O-methyltransferase n=1 Tax=Rhizocola hellebori TaxID=1392758 RepID=A0A8J3Q5E0_9ACTN|nr:O-methyltransferase [Rhizocola hellebori]GIH04155.1 O-methyltransferase [Rhizocola hellebori]